MPILESLDTQFNPQLPLWSKFRATLSDSIPSSMEECSMMQLHHCLNEVEKIQLRTSGKLEVYTRLTYHLHYLILMRMLRPNIHPSNAPSTVGSLALESLSMEDSFSVSSATSSESPTICNHDFHKITPHIQDYSQFVYVLQNISPKDYLVFIGKVNVTRYLCDYRHWRHLLETIKSPQRFPLIIAFAHNQYPRVLDVGLFTLIYRTLQNPTEVSHYLYYQKAKITPLISEPLAQNFLEHYQYQPQITADFFRFLNGSYAAAFPSSASLIHIITQLNSDLRIKLPGYALDSTID